MKNPNLISSFRYAWAGMVYALAHEPHIWMILVIGALVLVLGYLLGIGLTEYAFIVFAVVLTVCAEMLNTAVEATIDLVSPRPHPLAKIAKDVAAGAVLVILMGDAIVGGLIFLPPILARW
ncbi:MAG: diacylglycerol kinase family protein [Chloroflexota bacterium]|nr:MAG: diacylglycerol kinase family protein [Chloroflexota bacterium]